MDVLLRNQRIQKRSRSASLRKKTRQSVADFRNLKSIPVKRQTKSNSFVSTLFYSAKPLLINMIGFLLLVVVFLLLSGNPSEVSNSGRSSDLSATLATPLEVGEEIPAGGE